MRRTTKIFDKYFATPHVDQVAGQNCAAVGAKLLLLPARTRRFARLLVTLGPSRIGVKGVL